MYSDSRTFAGLSLPVIPKMWDNDGVASVEIARVRSPREA